MFARVVELATKQGKSRELPNTINEKVLSTLKNQPGFVDEIVLISDAEPDRVLAISFWNTRADAERYQRDKYKNVHETVRHLLETEPVIRTFEVHTSIGHRITAGKAA
jgi:heme-degrading monooxygenase HmoA